MSVKFEMGSDGTGTFYISGLLSKAEFESAQVSCESAIRRVGKIKLLVLLENFEGWEKTKGWEDLSFSQNNDVFIEKLAIVGEERWQDEAYMFTFKGLRPVAIEYFAPGEIVAARRWLTAP
jgi:hypothetical protein